MRIFTLFKGNLLKFIDILTVIGRKKTGIKSFMHRKNLKRGLVAKRKKGKIKK